MRKKIWLVIIGFLAVQLSCANDIKSTQYNQTASSSLGNVTAAALTIEPAPLPLPSPVLPPHATVDNFPLVVSITTEKQYYFPNQPVRITVTITNVGSGNVTVRQFPPEITAIADETNAVINLAKPGAESFELKRGFRATYNLTWDQQNGIGEQVPPGWYQIGLSNLNFVRENGDASSFSDQSARIEIQPFYPQGVWVGEINPGVSKVMNSNNVTLQHVSLSAAGSTFSFLVLPNSFNYSRQVSNVEATAVYNIKGSTIDAGFAGYYDDMTNGIRLVWGGNYPLQVVPKEATEITFTINSIVLTTYAHNRIDLGGPWEFKLPLQ